MMKVSVKSMGWFSSIYLWIRWHNHTAISPVQVIRMLLSAVGWTSIVWMLWRKEAPRP